MAEMDFHGLKRRDLQSLCKKHDIPANLSNFDMAAKLTSLLKGVEKPSGEGGSCLKRKDDKIGGSDSGIGDVRIKKVRLSLEKESVGLGNFVGSRVRSVEIEIADASESSTNVLEKPSRVRRTTVEDGVVMDSNPPVEKKRVRRTAKDASKITDKPPLPPPVTAEFCDKTSGDEPKVSKRRSLRKSPDSCVENTNDKSTLLPEKQLLLPAAVGFSGSATVEFSVNASGEVRKVPKRRSTRKSPNNCVETTSNEQQIPPEKPPLPPAIVGFSSSATKVDPKLPKKRLVGKKREGNAAKNVNVSDNAPPLQLPLLPSPPPLPASVVEFSGGADKASSVPKRRVLRKRGAEVEKIVDSSDEPMLPPLVPPPTAVQLAGNTAIEGTRLQKRKLPKNKEGIERKDFKDLNTSDNSDIEETQLTKRRLLRNREIVNSKNVKSPMPSNSVSKVRKPLQQLPTNVGDGTPNYMATKRFKGGTEETRKTTRRSARNKENVADFVIMTTNALVSNQVSKRVETNAEIEKTTRRSARNKENVGDFVIMSTNAVDRNQVSNKVEANTEIVKESNAEEQVKKQRITRSRSQVTVKAPATHSEIKSEEVLQLEEPLQHKRRNQNKRKCVEKKEEPLKGYRHNCRENDMSLNFSKRAVDTESTGNLIDPVNQVGQARGGVVFWCNGSGCFALPKW